MDSSLLSQTLLPFLKSLKSRDPLRVVQCGSGLGATCRGKYVAGSGQSVSGPTPHLALRPGGQVSEDRGPV